VTPRVVVVGLGPAGPELVTSGTLAAIDQVPQRYLRTARHPAASVLDGAPTFDDLYDSASTMDEVYGAIVDQLVGAAETHGEVLYAVPGSPLVAEHTVERLLIDDRVEVQVLPGLSFLDLAWVRLGIDPVSVGVRVVDGHRFAIEAAGERGPLLVAQCDRASVLSDIKLAVDEPPELPVTVIARLGLPDESITQVAWADLDRTVDPDHLTSLFVPELAAPVASEVQRFVELVAELRDACPWDREQTHRSLARYLIEEAYEVLEVLEEMPVSAGAHPDEGVDDDTVLDDTVLDDTVLDDAYDHLEEELGDLLFQICFHARLATEAGRFTLADVARRVHDKLVSRHPHVFGEVDVEGDARQVESNWEQIKAAEQGRASAFDGIPAALPALSAAAKLLSRAERIGVDPTPGPADGPTVTDEEAIGDLLLAAVATAHGTGVDPEAALRGAARRHERVLRLREAR
jgi:tetrapyrrole methylase family protein / MazG family protein